MLLFELVRYLERNGIAVKAVNGRLNITGDQQLLSEEVVAALKAHRTEIEAYYSGSFERLDPSGIADAGPQSFAQRRLYFLYQYDPAATQFILPVQLQILGALDAAAFCLALKSVVDRHKVYRTTYFTEDGVPFQRFESDRQFKVEYRDLTDQSPEQQEAILASEREKVATRPFDLEGELPVRASLLKQPGSHTLLLSFHHIATDEWSLGLFMSEAAAFYRVVGAAMAPSALSYLDYATWQNKRFAGGGYEVSRSFWRNELRDIKGVLELPLDFPRPAVQTYSGSKLERTLPAGVGARVAGFVKQHRLTEFSFYLAIYFLLLNKLTGERDLVVGTDVFGRDQAGTKDMAGFFVNQLALRNQLPADATVADFLGRVNASTLSALEYQDMPFDKVVDDLNVERDAAFPPVFQVKFLYERSARVLDSFAGMELRDCSAFAIRAQYDLTLKVSGDRMIAYYNTDLLREDTVSYWLSLYLSLLAEVLEKPGSRIVDLLQSALAVQLKPLTHGELVPVDVASLFGQIAQCAAATPEAVAIRSHITELTYAQLSDKVAKIAARLIRLGVRKGNRVGVFLERSPDMVAAVIAVMRVGGVLVPLDPSYPPEHVEYTLSDSGVSVVVTNSALAESLPEYVGFTLDVEAVELDPLPAGAIEYPALEPGDLAYLLYTSGSTGRPKGALISYASFANLCDWYIRFCGVPACSRVLLMIPIGFDASIKNIYVPLMTGGMVVLARPDRFDPEDLHQQIQRERVTLINCAPSAAYALLKCAEGDDFESLRSLQMLALGGEALDQTQLTGWLRSAACQARVANIYGPTECTDISTAFQADKTGWLNRSQVVIGAPIQNVQGYILDSQMQMCVRGVPGELFIAGAGVGNGYQNLPELTAASFVDIGPLAGRAYRTGDYCKYDRDGNIIYLGRRDGQIKVRGKRVEVGEIVATIGSILPSRTISVQLYVAGGAEMLLAFIDGGPPPMPAEQIKTLLQQRLPRHMVPAQLIFLGTMPLTPNGKICSRSLICLFESERAGVEPGEESLSPMEQRIAAVWKQLLHVPEVKRSDDFFSIGGDSIFSIQLVAELKSSGIEVSVADIFKHASLERLAEFVERKPAAGQTGDVPAGGREVPPFSLVPEVDREKLPQGLEDAYPLSPLQHGMLLHSLLDSDAATYHDVFSYDLTFDFHEPPFRRAIEKVVSLHPILRTSFALSGYSVLMQLVHPQVAPKIVVDDVSAHDEQAQEALIAERIQRIKATAFNLEDPGLIRISVLLRAQNRIQCIVDAHHAILDGWSMATVMRQIFESYRHYKDGVTLADVFDSNGLRFADYVAQIMDEEKNGAHETFWDRRCREMPPVGAISAVQPGNAAFQRRHIHLQDALVRKLEALAEREAVSFKLLMLMAHGHMLQALTGHSSVLTGVTDNGRLEAQGAQNVVGLFLNVLPWAIEPRGRSWRKLAEALRQNEIDLKPHRRYPLASVIRRNPQVRVDANFTYTNFHVVSPLTRTDWLQVKKGELFEETNFNLSTHVGGNAVDGFTVYLSSHINLSPPHVEALLRAFVSALNSMADDFDRAIPEPPRHWLPAFDGVSFVRHRGRLDPQALAAAAMQLTHSVASNGVQGLRSLCIQLVDEPVAYAHDADTAFFVSHHEADGWQFLALRVSPALAEPLKGTSAAASELFERYLVLAEGVTDPQTRVNMHSGWVDVCESDRLVAFWRDHLRGAPALLELPSDRIRPAARSYASESVPVLLTSQLTEGLRELSRRHGTTLFVTLLSAWAVLLSRLGGQNEVVICTPAPNRADPEPKQLIGFFVNALALRVRLEEDPSVGELLSQVNSTALGAYAHQQVPFEQVVEVLNPARSMSYCPIFQAMLALNNTPDAAELSLPGGTAQLDLALRLHETATGIAGALSYAGDLFDRATIERWIGYFKVALSAMVEDTGQKVSAVRLLSEAEREQVLAGLNSTQAEYPHDALIHQLFEAQVRKTPHAIALVCEELRLTYEELNRRANQLAHYLRGYGVCPGERVALYMERSPEMVIGLLAALKAGAAYVPFDPGSPAERLAFLLSDAAPKVVLTQERLKSSLRTTALCLDSQWSEICGQPEGNVEVPGLSSEHVAYVMYTSGSTGSAKGVMVRHRNIVNYTIHAVRQFDVASGEGSLIGTSMCFDLSLTGLYPPLICGRAVRLCAEGEDLSSALLEGKNYAPVKLTPTHLAMLRLPENRIAGCVRALVLGGEPLSASALRWWRAHSPQTRIFNHYGPTEATVGCVVQEVLEQTEGPVPIGRPISNAQIYILDRMLAPVPVGVVGEIYIGGAGVALGYLNRPELTAERFIESPFGAHQSRLYKTGDLGRWKADGTIEYLGRNDFQVKVRGFRIEPGEVEARLRACTGVREAVVLAREDAAHDKRLVAYVVGHEEQELSIGKLREQLSAHLPEYMIPSAFVVLQSLPLTANGKLDRAALPAPDESAVLRQVYEEPVGEVEQTLARIWQELLGVRRVGRQDHFFELGGHSLLAIRLTSRLHEQGLQMDTRALFTTPTLSALAASLQPESRVPVPPNLITADSTQITPDMLPLVDLSQAEIDRIVASVPGGIGNVQDIYPLAPLQQGILFHHMLQRKGDPYVTSTLLAFDHRERLEAFASALNAVVERHDILRTAVLWEGLSQPVQVVWRRAAVRVVDVALDAALGDVASQLRERFDPGHYRVDVRRAPMVQSFAAQDAAAGRWLLLLLCHHVVFDQSTLNALVDEMVLYHAGRGAELPAAIPFRRFVAQSRLGTSVQAHEAFFREMLGDVKEPTLPFGLVQVQGDGLEIDQHHEDLDAALSRRVRARARALGVSAASLFHLAFARVLAITSGREDVVFGTVLFGRLHGGAGAERAVGIFINTLPIRISVREEGAESGVRHVHAQLSALLRHEHASLALAQQCSGVPAPQPLFSALLNYSHARAEPMAWEGLEVLGSQVRTSYPLALSVDDLGEGFAFTAQVPGSVGARRICDLMRTAAQNLLDALERTPSLPVRSLGVLPPEERERVLARWNQTQAPFSADRCVHELFEAQVQRTPGAVAVVSEAVHLSYEDLNHRANQLARYLRAQGVGPDQRVGLCVERGIEMVVGLLGIMKAGGAYVPLEPSHPLERLQYMLEDAAPQVLLTQAALADSLPLRAQRVIALDAPCAEIAAQSVSNLRMDEIGLTSRHLAYVIYTSGSTGQPKGVMNEHRGVVNRLQWMQQAYQLTQDDRVLQKTPFGFDVSVWEFFWTLLYGARLIVARPQGHQDPNYVSELMQEQQVTRVHFVPSMLQAFLAYGSAAQCRSLRQVVCSGEELPVSLQNRFMQTLPQVQLDNLYGPTEAAVDVTYWQCRVEAQADRVPIGRPISNTQIYILDGQGQPVPIGVAGEIYIAGVGVARGYLNKPHLTAERFVKDPFGTAADARMYRTGDLGRWRSDGNIEYLGRNDFQVKIRGFRIELGEIEAQLTAQAGVREAVVIAREDRLGEKRLVGYVTGTVGLSSEELRGRLKQVLPEYMVPVAIMQVERLPLTANGKLDRKALPSPDAQAYGVSDYEAPQSAIEVTLAQIWQELLQVDRVGRGDSFFRLGGHSLLAVTLVSRLRDALHVEVALADLFAQPVLSEFAHSLADAAASAAAPIVRASRAGTLPLSFAQQRMWFLCQFEGASTAYHISGGIRLSGPLDTLALRRALDEIVARHEVLRTSFALHDGAPVQRIAEPQQGFALRTEDLCGHEQQHAAILALVQQEDAESFDLVNGPLIRGRLLRLEPNEHVLLVTMHHIVSDGWSLAVLLRELSMLYTAFLRGEMPSLPPLAVQYADYAIWQRELLAGHLGEEQRRYWQAALAGIPTLLELPTDRPRPQYQDYSGALAPVRLEAELLQALKALSQRHSVTLYVTLLAAWAALLARLSGQHDIVVGSPAANRSRTELEGLIGLFVNTLAMRIDLSGSPTVAELLKRVRAASLAAQSHQDLPFEQVVEIVQPARSLAHAPVFQVMFFWQNTPRGVLELPGLTLSEIEGIQVTARTDLTLSLGEEGDEVVGGLEYATALFDRDTIECYLLYWRRLLEAMVVADQQTVDRVPLLSGPERQRVLTQWNETAREYPRCCVHELFEQQAALTPDAVAVELAAQRMSYGELNRRANQLAHHLRSKGVGPGGLTGICTARSIEMLVGLLAVWKAGAAYMPLDPTYPAERLGFMLEDCAPTVLLTDAGSRRMLPAIPAELAVIDLHADAHLWAVQPESNLDAGSIGLTPEHLAYVIYTSGSTGVPKGVMVEQRNVVNFLTAMQRAPGMNREDCVLALTSLSFDIAALELYLPLISGARLVIGSRELATDPRELTQMLVQHDVTVLQATPATWRLLLSAGWKGRRELTALCGGEALSRDLASELAIRVGRLWNLYGPTETTIWSSARQVMQRIHAGPPIESIGRPIANTQIYVLDLNRAPQPAGVMGEIYIGGAGVARGYWNRSELTAERFVVDPFAGARGARMYRTGDLGRWCSDGTLEFLGRNDDQVKIRGFRIELGEIETRLTAHPHVREAAVVARQVRDEDKRLVAYYVGSPDIAGSNLQAYLSALLPAYMVPAAYVRLESMPLTPNGKLDRKALPSPDLAAYSTLAYEPPQGEIEIGLARIWNELLGIETIGRHDDFFELGGHSLLAVQGLTQIRHQVGRELALRDLFQHRTLSALATHLAAQESVRLTSAEDTFDYCIWINRTTRNAPQMFVMPPIVGGIASYHLLAAAVEDRIEVIGLDLPPELERLPEQNILTAVAGVYARCIAQVRDRSRPLLLAGWSLGAALALRCASELQALGIEPQHLFALDGAPAFDPMKVPEDATSRERWIWYHYAYMLIGGDIADPILERPEFWTWSEAERIARLQRAQAEVESLSGHVKYGDAARLEFEFMKRTLLYGWSDIPRTYSGPATFLISSSSSAEDARARWAPYVQGSELRFEHVAADHSEMMLTAWGTRLTSTAIINAAGLMAA